MCAFAGPGVVPCILAAEIAVAAAAAAVYYYYDKLNEIADKLIEADS